MPCLEISFFCSREADLSVEHDEKNAVINGGYLTVRVRE